MRKYKPEDIKPKCYPDEKPDSGIYWIMQYGKVYKAYFSYRFFSWSPRPTYEDTDMSQGTIPCWFIDIPGAPPELKPLAYPKHKPDEDGFFIVHNFDGDYWGVDKWNGRNWLANGEYVDYFIPVRLDRKDDEMETKYSCVGIDVAMDWDNKTKEVYIRERTLNKGQAVRIFSRYLNDVGFDVVKQGENKWLYEYKSLREAVNEVNKMFWDTDDPCTASEMKLAIEGILATHPNFTRKPEIKACPVCGGNRISLLEQRIAFDDIQGDYVYYQCDHCGVRTEGCIYEKDALTLWNALPRKGE